MVLLVANPVHYIITKEVWDKEEEQGEVARVDRVQPPFQWFQYLQTLYITIVLRNLGQGGGAWRSCKGGFGTTSSPVVLFRATPAHYIIVQEVLDKQEKLEEVARMYRVQLPVQWFRSLHTLYITLLRKKSGTRRRRREKLPGWTVYNLQSSGFIPCRP